jgi:hypothetical protein
MNAPQGPPPAKTNALPFSRWWPVLAGAALGIALRLAFSGQPGGVWSAMDRSFIYLAPFAVGAATVYAAERQQRRGWAYCVVAPMVANLLFVLGTMAMLIEGLICAVIIAPLFALLGAAGGLTMGALVRATRWAKGGVLGLGALPLVVGALAPSIDNPEIVDTIERSIVIAAPADHVWHQLHHTRDIRSHEVAHGWMYRIGVPTPLSGVTEQTPNGRVRKVTMGKSIYFEQVAAEWEDQRHVRWTYRFFDDSFPPHALDDHVRIGGHYFDLRDTTYTLSPADAGRTRLTVRVGYRLSTGFNWYADRVAQLLIGNFEETILDFYRVRAEETAQR